MKIFMILFMLFLIASVSCGLCPHASREKRQIGRSQGNRNDNRKPEKSNGQNNSNNRKPELEQTNRNVNQNKNHNNPNGIDRRPRPISLPLFPVNLICDPNHKYSKVEGLCNNLANPTLGSAQTSFKRYLPAAYDDGINSPRTLSTNGQQLPNPRFISKNLMNDNTQFEENYSDLLVYFGQFLAHDLTEFKLVEENNEILECPCGSTNPSCFSFERPANDSIAQTCFQFTRAKFTGSTNEQTNFLTSFIDATQVYGPSEEISNELRSFVDGQLRTSPGNYLPHSEEFICDPNENLHCFLSGDDRTSENLALTSLHMLFMREHNRIASQLANINTNWNDETLFQEARKILIAVIQNIIYKEWLPTVIGAKAQLLPLNQGYYNGYDSNANPAIANEFATSAFRFGHTLVRQSLDRYTHQNNNMNVAVNLSQIIFNSNEAYNTALGGIESIFMGLLAQPTSKFDPSFADTLQNHLFEFVDDSGNTIAIDLAAQNINRGRDMGLQPYYRYREMCGQRINSFRDLKTLMTKSRIQTLRNIYSSVKDIDLFVGSLHETPSRGALVGPTISCILEKQFGDLKRGDRFYYENGPSSTSFSQEQLDEIRESSMSRLICDNFHVSSVQPNAFKMAYPSLANTRTNCTNIPRLNLNKWRVKKIFRKETSFLSLSNVSN